MALIATNVARALSRNALKSTFHSHSCPQRTQTAFGHQRMTHLIAKRGIVTKPANQSKDNTLLLAHDLQKSQTSSWIRYRDLASLSGVIFVVGTTRTYTTKAATNSNGKRHDIQITDIEAELIAKQLQSHINIPGIPNAIQQPLLEHLIRAFIKQCPLVLPEGVFNKLLSGDCDEVHVIEEEVIREISNQIYIPFLSREAQHNLIDILCQVFFTDQRFEVVRRQMLVRSLRHVVNKESRGDLASELNRVVDIPLLGEQTEQVMAEKIISKCFDLFETFIPQPIRDVLDSTSPAELKVIRNNLVDRLNEKIDIPWTNEEDEKKAFRMIVDYFLSFYGLDEGTKNADEELAQVQHDIKISEIELEVHQENAYDKEQKMKRKIDELKKMEQELLKELHKDSLKSSFRFLKFWKKE